MKRTPLCVLAMLAACKSSPTTPPPPPPPPAVVCNDATPCVLTSGTAQQGDIAAIGQVDLYTIVAPANGKRTLLQIALTNLAPVSPVQLKLQLESPDGKAVLAAREWQTATGPQSVGGVFLLPAAGTFRLVVRDATNTHADTRNGYTLTATLLDDPDAAAEPDDTPPQARPLALTPQLAQVTGSVASAGDLDLCQFTVPAQGALVRWVASQPATRGGLRLRARLLRRSSATPDVLANASSIAEVDATAANAALAVDVVRSLPAGAYLIALDDLSGLQGDPAATWTAGVQLVTEPDPNEQTTRNDTAQTATQLSSTGSLQGAIGSQGDVDWYELQLPATATAQLLELKLDPGAVNQSVELTWAVGAVVPAPTATCAQCGPSAFCEAGVCGYLEHANHHFLHGETQPQLVRVRHLGAAQTVRVVVEDFGDQRWGTQLYTLSARLFADPDQHELTAENDTRAAATSLSYRQDADAGLHFDTEGQIASWDAIDGLTTAETVADVDWYALALPPRALAPPCPLPDAGQLPDGGFPDAGPDAGQDAGLCTPDPYDGGPVYLPRPDYGVQVHWHNPSDGVYELGLQGTVQLDAGTACLFSFDQTFAHLEDDGGYGYGNKPTDLCFCVPGRAADQVWVRLEAAHRPIAPAPNRYSDLPYSFEMDLSPSGLQPACDGGCAGPPRPSSCPGN